MAPLSLTRNRISSDGLPYRQGHSGTVDPLPLALALVCAWSAQHCATAQQQRLVYGPAYLGGASWYDARLHVIMVSDEYRQPEVVATLLVHETQNAMGDWRNGLANCVQNEAASERAAFAQWLWFGRIFGPPDPSTLTQPEASYVASLPRRNAVADDQARFDCAIAKP